MRSADEIVAAAGELSPETRIEVLRRIAASLGPDQEIPEALAEALWLEESTRRARDLREGTAKPASLEGALKDARSQLD
ncbi:MAG TPA: addiction module protein [Thermoanaerobaculia bacterium]|nr:addiction module protein [Thermoanaerobaculia bacterium]